MKHFTLVLNKDELTKLNQLYHQHLIENDNEHVVFEALHNQIKIIAYKSGKLLLQGNDVTPELVSLKLILNRQDYQAIGSDEVGTGDVFGPIVVCCCYTSLDDISYLESLNVRDSKNFNDQMIIEIAPRIAKRLTHSLFILPPKKYNELTKKHFNMNKIKAILHNQAFIKTTQKIEQKVPAILDQFCLPHLYFNYLKDELQIYKEIQFHTKAESVHISVAAASIIARYAFLVKMNEYSKKIDVKLLKGASKLVDEQLRMLLTKFSPETLSLFTKMNFKNVQRILNH